MATTTHDATRWLPEAHLGSADALGQALEACRGYLLLIAQRELDPGLHAKGGASDLVQQTLLDAVGAFGKFHGQTEAELIAWLRRILLNNVVSFTRLYRDTAKRRFMSEDRLEDGQLDRLPGRSRSPSSMASAGENDRAIRGALERLPDDYRQVLLLRHEEGRSFEEIGAQLDRTPGAARKLWLRALDRLQHDLTP